MDLIPEFFPGVTGFEWDEGNSDKNWERHRVSRAEAEQIFLNRPLVITDARAGLGEEIRYFALGRTDADRLLASAFTIRTSLLRVISIRSMSRRERRSYAKAQEAQANPSL